MSESQEDPFYDASEDESPKTHTVEDEDALTSNAASADDEVQELSKDQASTEEGTRWKPIEALAAYLSCHEIAQSGEQNAAERHARANENYPLACKDLARKQIWLLGEEGQRKEHPTIEQSVKARSSGLKAWRKYEQVRKVVVNAQSVQDARRDTELSQLSNQFQTRRKIRSIFWSRSGFRFGLIPKPPGRRKLQSFGPGVFV